MRDAANAMGRVQRGFDALAVGGGPSSALPQHQVVDGDLSTSPRRPSRSKLLARSPECAIPRKIQSETRLACCSQPEATRGGKVSTAATGYT
jgi:hypothetical protein